MKKGYKNLLITGAGGFIGHHIVTTLYNSGYDVIACYRKAPELIKYPWRTIEVDLLNREGVNRILSAKPDMLIHAAAKIPANFQKNGSAQSAEINKQLDDLVLDLCRKLHCRLIYFSTGTNIYQETQDPWDEESPLVPMGQYASGKVQIEQKITKDAMDAAIFRLSAPYGPGQKIRTVLRVFIEQALTNQDLSYYGSGSRQQDFIAAEDVADAVLMAIEKNKIIGVFNIASGNPISMKKLAELVIETIPATTSQVFPSPHPDPQENYRPHFNITKAQTFLGWQPAISLTEGITRWAKFLKDSPP